MQTPFKKKTPTGNKSGRPKATEVVAKSNRKMDEFYGKKPAQSDVEMPSTRVEEEKKREAPREEAVEYIKTNSNPQPNPVQQPAEMRTTGALRVQAGEESKREGFLTAKVDNPEARRIQMAEQMRRSKR